MWAEAQLDRRWLKEEQISRTQAISLEGIKSEGTNNNIAFEGGRTLFLAYISRELKQLFSLNPSVRNQQT